MSNSGKLYNSPFKNKVVNWIDSRLPILSFAREHLGRFQTPKNLNYAWNFGSLAALALAIQIITGIFLAMHYTPHATMAFNSVEHIMRDVNYGWLLRYMHAVGASMFMAVVYVHIARGLYYGSYKSPREILWMLGVVIFLIMVITAFMGYILPWGQMSFWGATVITNMFSAVPLVGDYITTFLWGGYSVDNPTLNRFFALHYLMPFILCVIVFLHIVALHVPGNNNPAGVEVQTAKDTVPFHPYYTVKDMFGFSAFLIIYCYFIFFEPNALGHPDNYIPANPLSTPPHIVPEWYFLIFYSILRAVPSKLGGVIAMISAIAILFFLPYLDKHPVKSGKYRPVFKKIYWLFILDCFFLVWLGGKPAEGLYVWLARLGLFIYFGYFLLVLPLLSKKEKALPLPDSIDAHYTAAKSRRLLKKSLSKNV